MHVSSKKMAFLGLLLAVAMVLTLLGGYFEPATLFFMAAAAFCTGIAVRECSLGPGAAFLFAGICLALIIAPNKLYCLTYGAMSLYIYVRELAFEKIATAPAMQRRTFVFWCIRYAVFNVMYIPTLIFLPKLIYPGKMSLWLLLIFAVAGQFVLLIYDKAYEYFQAVVWNKLRRQLKL